MLSLNLPPFDYRVEERDGKRMIFDVVRKKFIVLTPEEWVRQHVIHYLIGHLRYPRSLVRVEGGVTYNQMAKRSDVIVYDREGKPWMVVECKAPSVKLDESVIRQAAMYNAKLRAQFVVVTNGLAQAICQVTTTGIEILKAMPDFADTSTDDSILE